MASTHPRPGSRARALHSPTMMSRSAVGTTNPDHLATPQSQPPVSRDASANEIA